WGLVGRDGAVRVLRSTPVIDHRGGGRALLASADAGTVAFGFKLRPDPAEFSVRQRALAFRPARTAELRAPPLTAPGLVVSNWQNLRNPALDGAPLPQSPGELCRSIAILPEQQGVLTGGDWWVRRFSKTGQKIWEIPGPAAAWALNLSADGKLAVAAFADGTVRWLRASDGKELLALFVHATQKSWVAWTPSGYYDASAGGEGLIGWHVNQGKEREASFVPA